MISTERTPAIRPLVVDHRRVLGLGLEQVGERVAHHVVELEHRARAASPGRLGTVSAARSRSVSQPSGRRSPSTSSG